MEIKYKLYPYPVLSSYSDDYKTGSFDATIDVVRDGYNYRLDFLATLTCQSLLERIKNGDAKYVYHLECAQTGFRTVIQTDQLSETYTLFSQTVNGKLQICPFVVAVKDLKGYSSSDFHDDYQTSVYKGYKQDKIEMRGDRAEMSDFPLYLNTVAGGLDRRDQTIGGFSFVVKIYAVPVVEIIG